MEIIDLNNINKDIKLTHWSYFENWDPYRNYIYAKKYYNYDAFILLSNDTVFSNYKITSKISKILNKHKKIGILTPCSMDWGELKIIDNKDKIKYFWHIHSPAYIIRRSFIDDIKNTSKPGFKNFLFDGSNFRGYGYFSN